MNCRDVLVLIPAYLDEEVSPSEKKLIQVHLLDCPICQREFEEFGTLQKRLRQHLTTQAAAVAPSPQAWSLLGASLPSKLPNKSFSAKTDNSSPISRWFSIGKLSAQRITVALLLVLVLIVVAPPVWARLEPLIINWFSFSSPDGKSSAAIGGFNAFTPYHATYLPEGFQQSILGSTTSVVPEVESLEIGYSFNEQFILLVQSKGEGVTAIPLGEPALVNTAPAIFIPFFATSQEDLIEKMPTLSIDTNFDYENTHLLTWMMGETKIEVFSNLPKGEILKVAESLELMQATVGESPLAEP